jgi:protein DEK
MAETIVEFVSLSLSINKNVEFIGKVSDDHLEVSKKGIEACTHVFNLPSQVRKMIERFLVSEEEEKKPKYFIIEKGRGMPLKDIPNFVDRVHKRSRADKILKLVHTLLYGKRGKNFHMKNNIL